MVKKAEKVLGTLSKLYKLYSFSFYKQLFYYTLLKLSLFKFNNKVHSSDRLTVQNQCASFFSYMVVLLALCSSNDLF